MSKLTDLTLKLLRSSTVFFKKLTLHTLTSAIASI